MATGTALKKKKSIKVKPDINRLNQNASYVKNQQPYRQKSMRSIYALLISAISPEFVINKFQLVPLNIKGG